MGSRKDYEGEVRGHSPWPLRGETTASLVGRSRALEEVAPATLEAPSG